MISYHNYKECNSDMILNKEVSELESLIEAKIYREDELEREIERLKQKLSRRTSKSSTEISLPEQQRTRKTSSRNSTAVSDITVGNTPDEVCEICEKPGHDIFACPLLKDGDSADATSSASVAKVPPSNQLYCRDCESYGHVPADCPHSYEVF